MPFLDVLLKSIPKSAPEVVGKLHNALSQLEVQKLEKTLESITKYLGYIKVFLFGDEHHAVTKESVLSVAQQISETDSLFLLVKHLASLDFETRKDAAQVFGQCIRVRDADDRSPGAQFIITRPYILYTLFDGYDDASIALNCGAMLRDCFRDEQLARSFLHSSRFLELFENVEVANFEIASDAFTTFKDLLTRHKALVAQYLQEHYNEFFPEYMKLLKSSNYVTRRQSLKLLGELLLDKSNVKVMVRYVSDAQHLMQMMMMLKDPSRNIQFEAFHVFKVFVANPNKPQPIRDILTNNREKLLKYLEEFHTDRDENDEMFKEEKAVLIKEISLLGAAQQQRPGSASSSSASSQQQSQPSAQEPEPQKQD